MTIPFMVMSDAPITTTGLARITRELLKRMRTDPEMSSVFRVASLGLGQRCFKSLPYPQYPASLQIGGVPELMEAWSDFSQGEDGVLFTIWNPSWLAWLHQIPRRPFSLWGYFPVDAEGPSGTLPKSILSVVNGFDRRLAYSGWEGRILGCDYLPHGIDTSIFYPREVAKVEGQLRIGVCATNSRRKDWGLAAETCAVLKSRGHQVELIAKTDRLVGEWHLPDLFDEFGITATINCNHLAEDQMAEWYSGCDVTLAIGAGEGFGYPIAESLACGVPCIHGNYAGGAEVANLIVNPVAWRYDGMDKRPVFDPNDWADAVEQRSFTPLEPGFDWNNLWPQWKEWLLGGAR